MKLAFFSPFPPKQTGVAAYAHTLLHALRQTAVVTAFDHGNLELLAVDRDAVDYAATPEVLSHLGDWDMPIFSLGNNPHYHLEILRNAFRSRGLILLHDTVLYFLFAGLPAGLFYRHFCETYGLDRAREIHAIYEASPERNRLRYPQPARYPFLEAALGNCEGVIVHSNHAAAAVRSASPTTKVHLLPHVLQVAATCERRAQRGVELRRSVLKREGQHLLGAFGFLGPTKRLSSVCAALVLLPKSLDWHFVIVGEGPDPTPEFVAAGIGERVTWFRYVSDEDFDAWIETTDIILNLRYPSMGESSGTLSRAMGMGKVCLVTRHGSFDEFPDEIVVKIPHDESEIPVLAQSIVRLCAEPSSRKAIEAAAAAYSHSVHSPIQIASRMVEIVAGTIEARRHPSLAAVKMTHQANRVRGYLQTAVHNALPAHLRAETVKGASELPGSIPIGLTPEQVVWCYRVLLDRIPDAVSEVPIILRTAASIEELRQIILSSDEYRSKSTGARHT